MTSSSSATFGFRRSEEHTSELQSPDHLVCRLLLEKKKTSMSPPALCPSASMAPRCASPPPRLGRPCARGRAGPFHVLGGLVVGVVVLTLAPGREVRDGHDTACGPHLLRAVGRASTQSLVIMLMTAEALVHAVAAMPSGPLLLDRARTSRLFFFFF